ncbi:hypothetical protein T484DRAFT_2257271 [Baffinella frigidus]|nr:hypothetical protein T484DRAFT_2257271 [Cryptophyta sp. CCMP2293]
MTNLTKLELHGNHIRAEAGRAVAETLLSMPSLTKLDLLGEEPSDLDWFAMTGFKIPSEVLNSGKTSVVRAMRSESGTTEAIPLDERTIAIDVLRNWKVKGGRGLVFEVWDLGGQAQYYTSHSPYFSPRSLVLLVVRPTAEDGQYYTAGQLMEDFVLMWLRMLHAHVPSCRVLLVCSRWCSPPEGREGGGGRARGPEPADADGARESAGAGGAIGRFDCGGR